MKYLRFFSALLACLLMLSMGACAPREAVAAGDGVIDIIDVPEETAGQNAALPSPSATLTPIILGTPSGANPSVPMPTETPAFTAAPTQTMPPVQTSAPEKTEAPAQTEAPVQTQAPSETPAPSAGDDLPYYLYVEKGSYTLTIYKKGADGAYSEVYKTYRIAHGGNKTPAGTFTLSGDRERWHEFPDGGFTKEEIVSALDKAYAEDEAFKAEMHRKGEETVKFLEENGKSGIVLAGRPYHIDPEINHGLPDTASRFSPRTALHTWSR